MVKSGHRIVFGSSNRKTEVKGKDNIEKNGLI